MIATIDSYRQLIELVLAAAAQIRLKGAIVMEWQAWSDAIDVAERSLAERGYFDRDLLIGGEMVPARIRVDAERVEVRYLQHWHELKGLAPQDAAKLFELHLPKEDER